MGHETHNMQGSDIDFDLDPQRSVEHDSENVMKEIRKLKNPIQYYAWGSHTAIPELFGQSVPSAEPQAELWMGAHPKAPSEVRVNGHWQPLPELIERSPKEILGRRVSSRFAGKLPFLFKVLAAAKPLSIQAHPSLEQAREGFARENHLGIPLAAPNRNYRDNNHKPEIICALTPIYALNGFRPLSDMISLLQQVNPAELAEEINDLTAQPDANGLKHFFSTIMTMNRSRQERAVAQVAAYAGAHTDDSVFEWIVKLNAQYPGDIGVLSPLLLNLVRLEPGQAMYSQARQLHAYLDGTGIELMANSDNVLRGGLTPKHVDVPELLRVLTFQESDITVLASEPQSNGEHTFASAANEFRLSQIELVPGVSYISRTDRNIEIIICIEGDVIIKQEDSKNPLHIMRGDSILVPAAVYKYRIEGQASLFKASVP